MACATLKRTLDWESLNNRERPTKRRRCNPLERPSTSTCPNNWNKLNEPSTSPFVDSSMPKLTPGN